MATFSEAGSGATLDSRWTRMSLSFRSTQRRRRVLTASSSHPCGILTRRTQRRCTRSAGTTTAASRTPCERPLTRSCTARSATPSRSASLQSYRRCWTLTTTTSSRSGRATAPQIPGEARLGRSSAATAAQAARGTSGSATTRASCCATRRWRPAGTCRSSW